jgi:8-oxo-dGTP pyrophosphatase MutT (NUDIX family)
MPDLTWHYRLSSRPGHAFDWVIRAMLWLAYRILLSWWFIGRPQHYGAVVAIWFDSQILMIRHSYRSRLGWPGGGIRRGEEPPDTAIRELHEELAVTVDRAALAFVEKTLERWEYRYDHIWIFELTLAAPPILELDGCEVVAASFMNPAEVLAMPLIPFIRTYLQRRIA